MRLRPTHRRTASLLLALLLAVPAALLAHAVVFPSTSAPGAYEKYVLRVPNERDIATTRIELRFPDGVRVVSFADVPEWTLAVETDGAGRIAGAVWTGTLPVGRFVELPFVAVNPDAEARLVWPAFQTYADGERVGWTGPEGSATPASVTRVGAPSGGGPSVSLWLAGAALLLALIALGLSLRPRG